MSESFQRRRNRRVVATAHTPWSPPGKPGAPLPPPFDPSTRPSALLRIVVSKRSASNHDSLRSLRTAPRYVEGDIPSKAPPSSTVSRVEGPKRVRGHWIVPGLLLLMGCATLHGPRTFFGQQLESGDTDTPTRTSLVVWGTTSLDAKGQALTLDISNRGDRSIRFNTIIDEYVARTSDRRAIVLKEDFLSYPSELRPGSQVSVTLRPPKHLNWRDVTHIIATIDEGRVVLMLHAGRRPRLAVARRPPAHPAPVTRVSREQPAPAPVPPMVTPAPIAETAPPAMVEIISPPPQERFVSDPRLSGTIPVVISFTQEVGSSLFANMRWNNETEVTRITRGNREMFHLLPGRHDLYFECWQPPFPPTQGRIPIVAKKGKPMEVALVATPHLRGPAVDARVLRAKRVVWKRQYEPETYER